MLETADRVMMGCENFMLAKSDGNEADILLRAAEKLIREGASANR